MTDYDYLRWVVEMFFVFFAVILFTCIVIMASTSSFDLSHQTSGGNLKQSLTESTYTKYGGSGYSSRGVDSVFKDTKRRFSTEFDCSEYLNRVCPDRELMATRSCSSEKLQNTHKAINQVQKTCSEIHDIYKTIICDLKAELNKTEDECKKLSEQFHFISLHTDGESSN